MVCLGFTQQAWDKAGLLWSLAKAIKPEPERLGEWAARVQDPFEKKMEQCEDRRQNLQGAARPDA